MKKAFSTFLAIVILALCIPGATLATNETEASTTVTYTHEVVFQDEYIVRIPSQYNINEDSYLEITAEKMDIGETKYVYVLLDPGKNAMAGDIINLTNPNGGAIRCQVLVENSLNSSGVRVSLENTSYRVAYFNHNSLAPYQYGKVYVVPEILEGTAEGTYTGTLHFDIFLVDRQ